MIEKHNYIHYILSDESALTTTAVLELRHIMRGKIGILSKYVHNQNQSTFIQHFWLYDLY